MAHLPAFTSPFFPQVYPYDQQPYKQEAP
jgi:hypothetical protein